MSIFSQTYENLIPHENRKSSTSALTSAIQANHLMFLEKLLKIDVDIPSSYFNFNLITFQVNLGLPD